MLLSSEGESSRDSKTEDIIKLPENIPADILDIITNIKQAASTNWEGKVKFFTGPVNKMLLRYNTNHLFNFFCINPISVLLIVLKRNADV